MRTAGGRPQSADDETQTPARDSRGRARPGASPPPGALDAMRGLSVDQIRMVYEGQHVPVENANDRKVVRLQLLVSVALILGGAALAVIGILLIKESDATKLTAIVSLCTAVIGAGAALLPTGAAAGAAAGILTRSPTSTGAAGAPVSFVASNGHHQDGSG